MVSDEIGVYSVDITQSSLLNAFKMVLLSNVIAFLVSNHLLALVEGRASSQSHNVNNEAPTIRKYSQ